MKIPLCAADAIAMNKAVIAAPWMNSLILKKKLRVLELKLKG